MRAKFFTVPNQLTFLRMAFLPLFLSLVIYDHYILALTVLLLAEYPMDSMDCWRGS